MLWRSLTIVLCTAGCVAGSGDEPPQPGRIVINEVAPSGAPHDWFEIVNRGETPIELSDLMFVDRKGDFLRAKRFPELTLPPGGRHVQEVDRMEHGFQLGDSETLWIYRHDDRVVIDRVSWRTGSAPLRGSYARFPDGNGRFQSSRRPTPGHPNAEK